MRKLGRCGSRADAQAIKATARNGELEQESG